MDTIRWGIIGCGNISRKFAAGLSVAEGCELYACAARSMEKAEAFVADVGAGKAVEGYEIMLADEQVDAVYIGTPHVFHKDQAIAALKAGKAVLCEKPICTNAAEARELVAVAREENVFLMEAMWTRFFPVMEKLRTLIAEGAIGEIQMLHADFGFRCGGDPSSRLMDPNLAGGGLLDVGIYPLSFTHMLLGQPDRVQGMAKIGPTGVDDQAAWVLGYDSGALATGSSAVRTQTQQCAVVYGTEGMIELTYPWWCPREMIVKINGQEPEVIRHEWKENGYEYEAEAVAACLRAGHTESPVMPLQASLELQETMEELRAQFGLVYPWEEGQ